MRALTRLDWPVRTVAFSHDGALIASASEDLLIDIAEVASGEVVLLKFLHLHVVKCLSFDIGILKNVLFP